MGVVKVTDPARDDCNGTCLKIRSLITHVKWRCMVCLRIHRLKVISVEPFIMSMDKLKMTSIERNSVK